MPHKQSPHSAVMTSTATEGCYFCQHSFSPGVIKYAFLRIGVPGTVVSRQTAVHNTQPHQNLEFVD